MQPGQFMQRFRALYESDARLFRAPGRVNLIGEHTDYNDGFVFPAAIDFYTWVAIAPREDRRLIIRSENFSETAEFDLDDMTMQPSNDWASYVRGVAIVLERAGHELRGANMLILGEVPIGSGLSSSAAIEVASGYALMRAAGLEVNRTELALACQRAENEFVGTRCGIMDQFISSHGHRGKALMLDCRSLDYALFPLREDVRLVISNTMVKHELATGEYNARRAECEAGVRRLSQSLPHVRSLRDVTMQELEKYGGDLPELIYKRCRHVVSENERVAQSSAALGRGDLPAFGSLMADSHRSLRFDYEVSCPELDLMVELANEVDGVYGARMTGGGFGGSTINLVKADSVAAFVDMVSRGYERATGRAPEIYVSEAAEGVSPVEP
jgi:galactokinase